MKRYIRSDSQITVDKQQYIFDYITQRDPKFDADKDQLISEIGVRFYAGDSSDMSYAMVYLWLPDKLKDYIRWTKRFEQRNQSALQDFARTIYRWYGSNAPVICIWVDQGCSVFYINSLDMILIRIDNDGTDRSGYWTKYLITAINTNEFTIGYKEPLGYNSNAIGYVKKNGSTIMHDDIPHDANGRNNAYIALGLDSIYNCAIDFLEDNSCFRY